VDEDSQTGIHGSECRNGCDCQRTSVFSFIACPVNVPVTDDPHNRRKKIGFGEGSQALEASLRNIVASTFDSDGNVVLALRSEFENRVVRIGSDGIVTAIAGNGRTDPFPYNGPVTGVDARNLALPVAVDSEVYRIGANGVSVHIAGKRYGSIVPGAELPLDRTTSIVRADNGTIVVVEGRLFARVWRFENGQFSLVAGSAWLHLYQGPLIEGESAFRSLAATSAVQGCNGNVYVGGFDNARVDAAGILHPLRPDASLSAEFGNTLPAFRSMGGGCDGGVYMLFGGFLTKVNADDTVSNVGPLGTQILGSDGSSAKRFAPNGTITNVSVWGASLASGWLEPVGLAPDLTIRLHDFVGNSSVSNPNNPAPSELTALENAQAPIDGRFIDVPARIRRFAYGSRPTAKVAVLDRRYLREIAPAGTREAATSAGPAVLPTGSRVGAAQFTPASPPGVRRAAPSAG
jgi:hypothetical protein